jgi:hypothetical protein
MKHKVKHVHLVGTGGTAMSRKHGLVVLGTTRCDWPRMVLTAEMIVLAGLDSGNET